MKYTFHIVDVFSSTPFGGNQLAVLPDAAAISTEGMQKIAREFNFGETAFVLRAMASKHDFGGTAYRLSIQQGVSMGRRSHIEAEARKSGGAVTSVSVGGATAYIASGEIEVPPSALVSSLKQLGVAASGPRRGHCPPFTREKNAADTIFSDDSGRRARQKCDGTGAGCRLCVASEPRGIPAAIDAAITGPADKDRACMKALLIPEARMMFVSLGADGAPTYTLQTLDDWIARVKARGHIMLEEKQLKVHIERYSHIAHLWSSYALYSDGKQVTRGINSIQAIKEAGGWRVTGIMVQAESTTAPLSKEYIYGKGGNAKSSSSLPPSCYGERPTRDVCGSSSKHRARDQ